MSIKVPWFRFAGVKCGIKKSKKRDLALIFSERPATAAAIFTTNKIKAAPVLTGMKKIRSGKIQSVVINSGNANACTGTRGNRDAEEVCGLVASRLSISSGLVFPSSTGVVGVPLPIGKVRKGIYQAATQLSPESFSQAAEAILTTDRFAKTSVGSCRLRGKRVVVAGMAKGAGMIAPNMATMLAYVFTNAAVELPSLKGILARVAGGTFNAVTVDGDMSTNDTVLFLANGFAQNPPVKKGSQDEKTLERVVFKVMKELALKLVQDAEGGTKVAEIRVEGARSVTEAKQVAFSVANSNLVKTAFFGEDPNLGRIMVAIGYAGVPIQPNRISVSIAGIRVVQKGIVATATERKAAPVMRRPSFKVKINLGQGKKSASVWTSDLSYQYVRINSAYRT